MRPQDTLEQIRSANPEPEDPQAPPIEPLLARLDQTVRSLDDILPADRRLHGRPSTIRRTGFSVAALAVLVAGAILIFGRTGSGVPDVAAAIERAITPGAGVLHIVTESQTLEAGHVTRSIHEELWSTQHPRRLRTNSRTLRQRNGRRRRRGPQYEPAENTVMDIWNQRGPRIEATA